MVDDAVPSMETDFGVPFAGVVRPRAEWTQTALKRYPDGRPLDWRELFGREAPVVLDIGCGNGRYSLGSAVARPDFDHLGLDTLPVVIRYARRRGNQRGLANLKYAVGGGHELLLNHVAAGTVAEIHCYHPQPFYDPAQVHRRLITPAFVSLAHRALSPGGLFVIQTDNPGYWRYIRSVVPSFFDFAEQSGPWPDTPRGRTRREILARSKGLPIFRGAGTARIAISPDKAIRLAESLPPPRFDADRRLRQLDDWE